MRNKLKTLAELQKSSAKAAARLSAPARPIPMFTIPRPTPITAQDRLGTALHEIDEAIERTNEGRRCDGPTWANLHAAKRSIVEALQLLNKS